MPVSDATRRQYLHTLGVTQWERRDLQPAPATQMVTQMATQVIAAAISVAEATLPVAPGWDQLQSEVQACTKCGLHGTRTQTVFGVGNRCASWLFIGEAPGADEDAQGEPFVGRAGQLLNAMIAALGLKREAVYIANILKCRPPNNRDPQAAEVEHCEPYLRRQIDLIQPKLIVTLGRHAAHSLLKTDLALSKLRHQPLRYHDIPLVATYHPAYLLRTPSDKRKAWEDLRRARRLMQELGA